MTTLTWRAWDAEGKRYSSADTAWEELPDDGILAVVVYWNDANGAVRRRYQSGDDWYFKAGDVLGGNNHPPEETKARYPGAVLKRGKWVDDDLMHRVTNETAEATDPP